MSTTGSTARCRLAAAGASSSLVLSLLLMPVVMPGAVGSTAAAAVGDHCAPSAVPTVTWDGGGATNLWSEDANWSNNDAPGFNDSPLKRVCLPGSAVVTLDYGNDDGLTTVDSVDMAPGAVLTIVPSGRLLLDGGTSYVRRSDTGTPANLVVEGVLGGTGSNVVDGVLRLKRTASGPPTITTRYCELVMAGCTPDVGAPDPGRTTVGKKGLLRVTGIPAAASNLQGSSLADRHVLDVKGELRVDSPAYLAVDDGTTILVRRNKQARIVLKGTGSIYQGRFAHGDPVAVLDLRGTVAKSKNGTGLLDMDVKVARTARSEVLAGRLSIGGRKAPKAEVRDGATYGTGRCAGAQSNCAMPEATAADRLVVAVGMPRLAGKRSALVQVSEKAAAGGALVPPVDIHVTKSFATATKPMTFAFLVDATALGTRSISSLKVSRDGQPVKNCKNGKPVVGAACVIARGMAGTDALLVVRTRVSSRWKIR